MARWRDFEKLATKIFTELQPLAEVKWNDHIYGHLSETERQIDVSVRWEFEGNRYLTIVQTKDYGTPADINEIGEFLSVIKDVRASSGTLVCRSGFTASAHTYARNCGISLMNLHDAESANWSLQLTIPIVWIELTPQVRFSGGFRLEAGDSFPDTDPSGPPMTPDGGRRRINPISTFMRYWNGPTANRTLGAEHRLASDVPLQLIVQDINGEQQLRPVEGFAIIYTVQQCAWLGRFQPSECRGLVDYLDGDAFTASYLPISELPTTRDEQWQEVPDPLAVVVNTRGTVVTTTEIAVLTSAAVNKLDVRYVGETRPDKFEGEEVKGSQQ